MKVIKRIDPVQCGAVIAFLNACIGIIAIPTTFIKSLGDEKGHLSISLILLVSLPFLYAIGGFIGGMIAAFLYNLCAKFVGGIKITLEDEEISQSYIKID